MKTGHLVLALCCLRLAACAGPGEGSDDVLRTLPTWKVGPQPTLVIGDSGAPGTQFLQVVPARLGHDVILAADIGSRELRVFRGKTLVARLSRAGRGPGEFTERFVPAVEGDTIFAIGSLDGNLVRVFAADRGFVRQFRLHRLDGGPRFVAVGRLQGGAYLVEEGPGFRSLSAPPPADRVVPDSVSLGLVEAAPEGSVRSYVPIGRYQRGGLVPHDWPGGLMSRALSQSPFTIGARWVGAGDRVWIADAATGIVTGLDAGGVVTTVDTLQIARRGFDAAEMNEARSEAVRRATDAYQRASAEAIHDPALRPALMPVFDQLLPGADGELWIRLFELVPGPVRRYVIIGRTGQAKATVHLPGDVNIHQVGADFILGVRRDADGVETIVEFALDRGR